jgi:4-amino-4-deoxy-L-arabinose transferase-like glycosyltransferase
VIAAGIRLFCDLFGQTPLGIRFGVILITAAMQGFIYLLARDLYGEKAAFYSLLLLSFTPLATAGGFISTYDPYLVFFWCASLYYLSRAMLFSGKYAWGLAGLLLGFGMLSKHTIILLVPCLLIFFLMQKGQRRWLVSPYPWVAFLIGLLVFSPNLLWQSHHQWMTFDHLIHLTEHARSQDIFKRIGDYIGSQAALLTPFMFIAFVASIFIPFRYLKDKNAEKEAFLVAFGAPVLIFFLIVAFKTRVQGNWAVCGWITPTILYTHRVLNWVPVNMFKWKSAVYTWQFAALSLLTSFFLTFIVCFPSLRMQIGIHISPRMDQLNRLYGGKDLGVAAGIMRRELEKKTGKNVVVGAATYDNASRLAFYLPGQPHVYCFFLSTRANSYLLWNYQAGLHPGSDAIVVDDLSPDDPHFPAYSKIFHKVLLACAPLQIFRPGIYNQPIHTYYIYKCIGYHPNTSVEKTEGG